MDDVVAVEVTLRSGERRYFLTWGRIQDTVDPRPLARLILRHANAGALAGDAVSARVCASLQAAAGEPWFHECLFGFAREPAPFGPGYEAWRARVGREMADGKHIAYCGDPAALAEAQEPDAVADDRDAP